MGKLLSAQSGNKGDALRASMLIAAPPVVLLDGLFAIDLTDCQPVGVVGEYRPEACGRLAETFLSVAASRANHPAVVTGSGSHSYRALAAAALRVATCLRERCQVSPQARVLLMLANGAEYLAAFYGTLIAGGVPVPLPPNIEASRATRCGEFCEPRVVLTTSDVASRRHEPAFAAASAWDSCDDIPCGRSSVPDDDTSPARLAMILFTSGSSGEPKGVMLSHENLLANAQSILAYLPITPEDRALALLPFYHAFGNSVLQTHVLRGATLVVDGSPAFPGTVTEALRRHAITSLSAVPEIYQSLLTHSDLSHSSLPSLRYMTVAGGALSPNLVREVASRIAPAEFFVMYGQSEATARLAYLPPADVLDHPGAIGRAIPGVTLQIVDDAGQEVPPGVSGELEARGPNVMLGYWRDPVATAAAIRNGWLRTGDLGVADETGLIQLHGRRNQLVKVQGIRLHPAEVEEIVARQWCGCQPIVVPYQQAGSTRLALFVVPGAAERPSIEDLHRHCLRELPRQKVPTQIEILHELPLNASLKVDRPALTRRAESASRSVVERGD